MAQYIKTEEGYKKFAAVTDDKMDKIDPVGTGSFSMNRKAGTVIGTNSHAEGNDTTASGSYSHAEGDWTTASGKSSHAEGYYTKASGPYSHAEGYNTTASGDYSHAEGYKTIAGGQGSHAEGSSTKAHGGDSHAEGYNTTASGNYSHAEGYNTTANGSDSHVQGKCNIADTSNKYADIIGNGTSNTARSNAATVDWEGNAWFAGDVYTGSTSGTNKDEGSKKLATEEYVNGSIAAGGIHPSSITQGSFGYWYVDGNSAFGVISANPGKYAIVYVSSIYGNLPLYLSSISDTEIIYKNTAADGSWVGFKIGSNSSLQDCGPIAGTLNVHPDFEARLFLDNSIPYKLNLESGIAVGDLVNAFDEGRRVIARLCVNEDDDGMPFEMQMYQPGSSSGAPDTITFAPCSISSASIDGEIPGMNTVIIGFEYGDWYFSGFALDSIGGAAFETPYTVPFEVNAMYCKTFDKLVSATHDFRWRAYIYKGNYKLYLQIPEYSSSVTPNILYFSGITEPDGSGISSCVWTTVRIEVSPSNVILWDNSTLPNSNSALDTWDYYKLNKDQSGALRVYDVFNEEITILGLVGKGVIEYGDYRYVFNRIAGYSLLFYCMDFTNSSVPKISTISIDRRTNTIGVTNFQPLWEIATESEVNNAVDDIFKTI